MEYQAMQEESQMLGTTHPWDTIGATDAFRVVYSFCTDGGDLDTAGPIASDMCAIDLEDACGDLPIPDGPNMSLPSDYADGG
jgi:hypothetical protein